jgi:hypothetical protein
MRWWPFCGIQQRVASLAATAAATERALELELLNFEEGETDFGGVFVLQGDLAAKQDRLAAAQGDVVTSLVAVYRALGGGWQIRCPGFQSRSLLDLLPAPSDEMLGSDESELEELPLPPAGPVDKQADD